jgi:DNA-directed RNA polymerase subunit RPC12/RpoP
VAMLIYLKLHWRIKMTCEVCGKEVERDQIEESSGGHYICLDCWNNKIDFTGGENEC